MKDEKKIREKYKQLKYQHLKKIYEKNLSKLPENCKYNKVIVLPNRYKVNVCSFDFENNTELDLCYKPEHSRECNAFCPLTGKEKLREDFQKEVEDDQIRATKYKDLNTIFWLMPDVESKTEAPKSFWRKIVEFFSRIF